MIERASLHLGFALLLAMTSGCSFHLYAGTGTSSSRETHERRDTRRYRISYRTQAQPRPIGAGDDDEQVASGGADKAGGSASGKDKAGSGKTGAGKTDAQGNVSWGSPGKPKPEQAAGNGAGTAADGHVVLKPEAGVTGDDSAPDDDGPPGETEEERARRHQRTAQERVEELVDQKDEELKRKEAERRARMKRVLGEAAEQHQ